MVSCSGGSRRIWDITPIGTRRFGDGTALDINPRIARRHVFQHWTSGLGHSDHTLFVDDLDGDHSNGAVFS